MVTVTFFQDFNCDGSKIQIYLYIDLYTVVDIDRQCDRIQTEYQQRLFFLFVVTINVQSKGRKQKPKTNTGTSTDR